MDDSQIMTGIDDINFLHDSRKLYFDDVYSKKQQQLEICKMSMKFQGKCKSRYNVMLNENCHFNL